MLLGTGFMLSVDFSILNIALPAVGAGVGLTLSQLPWVLTAYALPCAGFTLLFGRIADLFGRRRLFLTGMGLMVVSCVLGGLAINATLLLMARWLQGLATAIATPASLALLITTFSDEKQRARVLGFNGALLSGGFTVGTLLGGVLVNTFGWRAAFLINVPVVVLIIAATPFLVRPSRAMGGVKLDVPGAFTVTGGLLSLTFGVINANVLAAISGLVLLLVFCVIEQRAKAPLAAMSILLHHTVKWGNIATLVIFAMEPALIFLMTLYLQKILHLSPLTTGLVFGPPGLASVIAGILAGRFIGRYGQRNVLVTGMLVQAGSTVPLCLIGAGDGSLAVLIAALFLGFFGHVTAIVAGMATATSGVSDAEQGLATGLVSMAQQVGITIGIPVLSAIARTQQYLLAGIHVALTANVLVTLAALTFIWMGLRPLVFGALNQQNIANT